MGSALCCQASLALATFCQQLAAPKDADGKFKRLVREGLGPRRFVDLPATLAECHFADRSEYEATLAMLESVIHQLRPIAMDKEGFKMMCEEAQLCWPKVWYLRALAERGGAFPRQQDVQPDGCVVGYPVGCKLFVVSHAWESQYHPAPSGAKLQRLVTTLDQLQADDDDVCFLECARATSRRR
ncbi:hypothetical protein OAO87_04355 [bacterium]|nr:hypothetical protein [bacterium]